MASEHAAAGRRPARPTTATLVTTARSGYGWGGEGLLPATPREAEWLSTGGQRQTTLRRGICSWPLPIARSDGDVRTYQGLLTEATTEPARSLVLIDTFVRFLLTLAGERPSEPGMCPDDLLRMLAVVLAPNQDGPSPA